MTQAQFNAMLQVAVAQEIAGGKYCQLSHNLDDLDAVLGNIDGFSDVKDKVEAVSIPSDFIGVEAADLQAYIDALPRLRTENLNIQVQAGHVPQTLKLENFYGPGFIWLVGRGPDTSFLDDGLVISNCSIAIRIISFDIRGYSVGTGVSVSNSKSVSLENLVIDGSNFADGAYNGISADISCMVAASNCTISHFTRAVYTGAVVRLINCGGSDNASGIAVEGGGIVLLSGSTPELMGGSSNSHWGGMIVRKDGTLL